MIHQSSSTTAFTLPSRPPSDRRRPQHHARRRNSNSSFGSWSSGDESSSSFRKVAVGELPTSTKSSSGSCRQHRPAMIGVATHTGRRSSEHWNSFHKRFQNTQDKEKGIGNPRRVIFSRMACRMLLNCATGRTVGHHEGAPEDWSDTLEVPLSQRGNWCFWDGGNDNEEEEYRVDLTE